MDGWEAVGEVGSTQHQEFRDSDLFIFFLIVAQNGQRKSVALAG